MKRSPWTGTLLAAALLLTGATAAHASPLAPGAETRFSVSALWDLFLDFIQPETDNRGTIDPDGLTATGQEEADPGTDNRWTIDPDGLTATGQEGTDPGTDNRWTIDPEG